jgi:CubicO group peptidase (beta-lactamase class C family)
MRRHSVPGVSLALVRDREMVWDEAFGVRDIETKAPLTPGTVFEAASLSKPAYAYCVLKLVELKKFDLHRPVMEYLPPEVIPEDPRFKLVTAWHLLTHTSGIEGGPPKSRRAKLEFTPGERSVYSPHGFDFLQVAVERATGEQVAPVMERMLVRPFGMTATSLGYSEAVAQSGARGYDAKGAPKKTFNERFWRWTAEEKAAMLADYPLERFPSAAAGINSTPSDYARFLIEVMKPSGDASHIGPRMLKEMLKPHARLEGYHSLYWGLGFAVQRPRSGPASFWHSGDWGIFKHYAVAYRDTGAAFVIMTNSGNGYRVCREASVAALGLEQPAFQWMMG